ncbi:MAG TPA: DUF427 domain-containing protein [Thermohalobaculum sp.]|nr:DUF427 domain-containing protein [Thermohalobaculum sp.]
MPETSAKFTIASAGGLHVARAGGAVLAETSRAQRLSEAGHEPVLYFPREDVGTEFLERSPTRTTCPHKGEATHYHIVGKSRLIRDAAWSYEAPKAGAEAIAGHIAFDAAKVTVEEL